MLKRLSLIILTVNGLKLQEQILKNEASIIRNRNYFELHKNIENRMLLQIDSDVEKHRKRHSDMDDFNIMIAESSHKQHHKHHHHQHSHQSKHHHHHQQNLNISSNISKINVQKVSPKTQKIVVQAQKNKNLTVNGNPVKNVVQIEKIEQQQQEFIPVKELQTSLKPVVQKKNIEVKQTTTKQVNQSKQQLQSEKPKLQAQKQAEVKTIIKTIVTPKLQTQEKKIEIKKPVIKEQPKVNEKQEQKKVQVTKQISLNQTKQVNIKANKPSEKAADVKAVLLQANSTSITMLATLKNNLNQNKEEQNEQNPLHEVLKSIETDEGDDLINSFIKEPTTQVNSYSSKEIESI